MNIWTVESLLILIFKCPKINKDEKIRKGGLPDDEGRSGTVFILCNDDW